MHKLYCHHPPRASSSHESQIDVRGRGVVGRISKYNKELPHTSFDITFAAAFWCGQEIIMPPPSAVKISRLVAGERLLCSEHSWLPLSLQVLLLHDLRSTHVTR